MYTDNATKHKETIVHKQLLTYSLDTTFFRDFLLLLFVPLQVVVISFLLFHVANPNPNTASRELH